jgi:hypothetical protein
MVGTEVEPKSDATYVKARSILRQLGYSERDAHREYKDWHIEIRSGLAYVSVWTSRGMVFLSLGSTPVFYRPGPWEQYLDRLFHRVATNDRAPARAGSTDSLPRVLDLPETSADN